MVPPGTYQARLRLGDWTASRPVVVRMDPRVLAEGIDETTVAAQIELAWGESYAIMMDILLVLGNAFVALAVRRPERSLSLEANLWVQIILDMACLGVVIAAVMLVLVLLEPDILEAPFENERTILFTVGGTALAAVAFVAMLWFKVPAVIRVIVLVVPFGPDLVFIDIDTGIFIGNSRHFSSRII